MMSQQRGQEPEEFVEPDTYVEWQKREGVKVIYDYAFENLNAVELSPWRRKGGAGAIINIPYPKFVCDSHLVELKAGGSSEPEHHVYEEAVYVLKGLGATTVWSDENRKVSFEWHEGSAFAIPVNAWYQHHNGSGSEPARYISVTNAPQMMRLFRNLDFIFDNPFVFNDRFQGESSYFGAEGKLYKDRVWKANFISDARSIELYGNERRGAGRTGVTLEMASNLRKAHISEWPVGTYMKAHRHGPGAHLFTMTGQGFSLLWQEGDAIKRKVPWKAGGMIIVPTEACFHQHCNTGNTLARHIAFRGGSEAGMLVRSPGRPLASTSLEEGGWQIEYANEDPDVHQLFEEDLRKNGVICKMKGLVPGCTGVSGEGP